MAATTGFPTFLVIFGSLLTIIVPVDSLICETSNNGKFGANTTCQPFDKFCVKMVAIDKPLDLPFERGCSNDYPVKVIPCKQNGEIDGLDNDGKKVAKVYCCDKDYCNHATAICSSLFTSIFVIITNLFAF